MSDEKKESKSFEGVKTGQGDLPKALQEKSIKTEVSDMKTIIQEKLDQLKDLATLEVMLDVHTRMKKRLESLKEMSSADHRKVRGHWKTFAPKMHVVSLEGKKVNNDEVEISFGIYETDDKGNKLEHKNFSEVEVDGKIIKKHLSSEYRVKYEVKERIKSGKPITREVVRVDRIQEE